MSDQPEPVRPGRKRSTDSKRAILAAAAELVAEVGYAGLTIEGIATRAGTGKQTIYRWWPSKADVLMESLAAKADLHIPVPDEGDFAADLRAFLTASFALGRNEVIWDLLPALLAEAQINDQFAQRFRAEFVQRRRDALGVLAERAQARGDLPPGCSPGTLADIVFGVIWYRLAVTRQPPAEQLVDELVTVLARS